MTWTVDIPVTVEETRPETPELQTLSMLTGDHEQPANVTLQLGVKVDGAWHPAASIDVLRLEDAPSTEEEPEAQVTLPGDAANMRELILTARIDGGQELAQRFGIPDGTALATALPQAAWGLLYPAGGA
jgi:hypothetical protein